MLKRWFCLALALAVVWASLSLAEETVTADEPVILDGAAYGPDLEALPDDIEIASLEALDLDLSDPDGGGLPGGEAALDPGEIDLSNDNDNGEPRLTLSASKLTIGVKEKCTILTATRDPEDSGDTVTWSSSKTSVAKVNQKTGAITGVKKGTATITATTASGLKASCTVTVKKAPGKVTLTPGKATLSVGETCALKAKLPSGTGSTLTFTSDSKKVATVDKHTGLVTAVAPGSATITVKTFNGKKAACTVTVEAAETEVFLPETLTIGLKEKTTVQATALNAKGAQVQTKFTYRAVNGTGRITVNAKTGKVVGKALGTATIYVTTQSGVSTHLVDGQIVETACQVQVVEAAGRIELAADSVTIGVGQTFDMHPRVLNADGTQMEGAACSFAVSGGEGVSVSAAGVVTGLDPGSYTVTATAAGAQAQCVVTVLPAPSSVALMPERMTLAVGTATVLEVTLSKGTMAACAFTSSAPEVATVDSDGKVTAVAPGTAVVRVETHNALSAECTITVIELIDGFSVSPASVAGRLDEGGVQLTWQFSPEVTPTPVRFESDNPLVATVSGEGYVTFVSAGTAKVTATTEGGQTATVDVTVLESAKSTVNYRLFAAYSYYNSLPFVKRNSEGMADVFGMSAIDGQGYDTKVLGNPTKDRLISGIASFFDNADEDDVSIVYLCSHGHNNKSSYSSYRLSLTGYDTNKNDSRYYLTSKEIFNSVQAIRGNVILILDTCYSGTFINDMKSRLDAENGRIAVLTAASNTKATFYNSANSVDFFTFFLLQGLGYNEKDGWWIGSADGDKGSYPGYLSADVKGNGDGAVTLGEMFSYASNCIDVNIPKYMSKSWYWGEKSAVQKSRIYAGNLKNLVVYQPK